MTITLDSKPGQGANFLMKGYIIDAIQKGHKVIVDNATDECAKLVEIFGKDKIEVRS